MIKLQFQTFSVSLTQQTLNIIKHQNYCEFSVNFPIGHSTNDASVGWFTIYM